MKYKFGDIVAEAPSGYHNIVICYDEGGSVLHFAFSLTSDPSRLLAHAGGPAIYNLDLDDEDCELLNVGEKHDGTV